VRSLRKSICPAPECPRWHKVDSGGQILVCHDTSFWAAMPNHFQNNTFPSPQFSQAQTYLDDALALWNEALLCDVIRMAVPGETCDVIVQYASLPVGLNGTASTGAFTDCRVFDHAEDNGADPSIVNMAVAAWNTATREDFFKDTLAHEIGHILGLPHPDLGTPEFNDSIMANRTPLNSLGMWDVGEVQRRYPCCDITTLIPARTNDLRFLNPPQTACPRCWLFEL